MLVLVSPVTFELEPMTLEHVIKLVWHKCHVILDVQACIASTTKTAFTMLFCLGVNNKKTWLKQQRHIGRDSRGDTYPD